MAKIESQIGNVVSNPVPGMMPVRRYVVDDPTGRSMLTENQMQMEPMEPMELDGLQSLNPAYLRQQNQQQQQQVAQRRTQREQIIDEQKMMQRTKEAEANREMEVRSQINESKKRKNTIGEEARRKIEALLGLRRITKSKVINGVEITLRNLTGGDTRIFLKTLAELVKDSKNDIDMMFYSRHIQLALSLYKIDGEDVGEMLGEETDIDVELRLSLIEGMAEDVVKELQTFYEKEIGIKLPQSTEDAKEIGDNLKK